MSSPVDEGSSDYDFSYDLPPLPVDPKSHRWGGKEVQRQFLNLNISPSSFIPRISDAETISSFYQRNFIDLTHADLDDEEEEEEIELAEQEWALAQAMTFIEKNYREDLTVEELLALRGMRFDHDQGRNAICKSIVKKFIDGSKKVCHETKKGLKKAAKKTKKAAKKAVKLVVDAGKAVVHGVVDAGKAVAHGVKEAGKEVAHVIKHTVRSVGKGMHDLTEELSHAAKEARQWLKEHPKVTKAVVIVAIVVAVVAAAIVLYPIIAPAVGATIEAIVAAVALAYGAVAGGTANGSPKTKEGDGAGTDGPDHQNDPDAFPCKTNYKTYLEECQRSAIDPEYVSCNNPYIPIPDAPTANHPKTLPQRPTPSGRNEANQPDQPPPTPQPAPAPSSMWTNIFNVMRQGLELVGSGLSEPEPPPSSPKAAEAAPENPTESTEAQYKSPYGVQLENEMRKAIDPSYQPPLDINKGIASAAQRPNTEAGVEPKSNSSNFWDTLRRGLQTIGEGMSETELRDPNTPLDIFHKDYADSEKPSGSNDQRNGKASTPDVNASSNTTTDFTEMLQKFFGAFQGTGGNAVGQGGANALADVFKEAFESVQNGLKTIGKGMCEPELLDPNSPLDIFNKEYGEQSKEAAATNPSEDPKTVQRAFLESSIYGLFGSLEGNVDYLKTSDPEFLLNKLFDRSIPKANAPTESCYFKTAGKEIPGHRAGFVPGMDTSYDEALQHAYHIKKFAGDFDICIEGVYNHSNGKFLDSCEIFLFNYFGVAPKTAKLLTENWTRFYEETKDNPHAKYLQFAHSMGSIIVDATLRKLPKEIRDRIIVVTIGTAKVVPEELCYRSHPYRSRFDIIHLGQDLHAQFLAALGGDEEERAKILQVLSEAKSLLIVLEPHKDAKGFDHDCESPTNDKVFSSFIQQHIKNNGEYK